MDYEYIIEFLREKGYLEYGKIIPKDLLEFLLNIRLEKQKNYMFALLKLQNNLKLKRFFSTRRKCEAGCLRMLEKNEYSSKTLNGIKSSKKKNEKHLDILRKTDFSDLSDKEKKRVQYVVSIGLLHKYTSNSMISDL